jgi:hypothetical protein
MLETVGGYTKCDSPALEPGFEKLAIYGDRLGFTHVAKQLPTGVWTSKLGAWEDIEHNNPEALEGKSYGRVKAVIRRPI